MAKKMTKLLIFDAFTLSIREKNVTNYALLWCKSFSLKIWLCKFFFTNIMSDSNRILLYFRLSVLCQSVTRVKSNFFSIIRWFRPCKPDVFRVHIIEADHLDHLDYLEHRDRFDQSNHSDLEDNCKIRIVYLVQSGLVALVKFGSITFDLKCSRSVWSNLLHFGVVLCGLV